MPANHRKLAERPRADFPSQLLEGTRPPDTSVSDSQPLGTVRPYISVVWATQSVVLCDGHPGIPRQCAIVPLSYLRPQMASCFIQIQIQSLHRDLEHFYDRAPPTTPVSSPTNSSLIVFSHTSCFSVPQSCQALSPSTAFAHAVPCPWSACLSLLSLCMASTLTFRS